MTQKALGAGDVCFRVKVTNTNRKVKLCLRDTKKHFGQNAKQPPACPKSTRLLTHIQAPTASNFTSPGGCRGFTSPWRGDAGKEPTESDPRNASPQLPTGKTQAWRFCIGKKIEREKPHTKLEKNT